MARFVSTRDGEEMVNLDHVRIVRGEVEQDPVSERRQWFSIAVLDDDTEVALLANIDEVANFAAPVIPASPGYIRLRAYYDDDDGTVSFDSIPIVGWQVHQFAAEVDPICLETAGDNILLEAIKTPDGLIIEPGSCKWASEEEWQKEARDMAKDRQRALRKRRRMAEDVEHGEVANV
jgi:hypothetical protein